MGSPYQSQSASGYNSSPPPDDGSTVASNKITWSGIKTKLADAIKTLADAINTQLRASLNVSPSTTSAPYTTLVGDHLTTIEVTGTTAISLGDAATMIAQAMGYTVTVYNKGTATVTAALATAGNTLAGQANGTVSLAPGQAMTFTVAQSGTGYDIVGATGFAPFVLTGAAGTNTATAAAPSNLIALYSGLQVWWTPAATTTGATTLAITPSGGSALTAKNVFTNGAAATGGEYKIGVPQLLEYDGTQFNKVGGGSEGFANQSANTLFAGPTSGAAAQPTFRTPVGADGASLVLLATAVAANSATIDITTGITNAFDEYLITISDLITATDNVSLSMRFSEDGGSTFKAGGTDYAHSRTVTIDGGAPGGAGGNADSAIVLGSALSNSKAFTADITFNSPAGTAHHKLCKWIAGYEPSASTIINLTGAGVFKLDTNAINAVRFLASSGNITLGNFALYGVRKS